MSIKKYPTTSSQTQVTSIQTGAAWYSNLSVVSATTTNSGDSVKIASADGSALSASNSGSISLPPGSTAGARVNFTLTSNVTILLTGATWGNAGLGDLTGALLRVLAINDNGTLKWGVALLGGRNSVLTTDTTATQASVTTPEGVLCNSAVASASNSCQELGFVRANFDDTGGAAEDLWAIQTGKNDVYTGISADGYWKPWNPTFTGFSANPTITTARWTQIGRNAFIQFFTNAPGTSNSTAFTMTMPAKASRAQDNLSTGGSDNSAALTSPAYGQLAVGSTTLSIFGNLASANWTNSGTKSTNWSFCYEVGPVASFVE